MTSIRAAVATARRRTSWFVRDRFPNHRVVRDVQGVRLVLPWAHRLPDYAGPGSVYGQNLVELARELHQPDRPLRVLDVGANVGDSALQILNAVDAKVLCVEADTFYLDYLHANVDPDDRVSVVEALLVIDETTAATTAVRSGGTTRFEEGSESNARAPISTASLRRDNPEFSDLRLVKSDTDGYDVALVPAIASTWADSRPVLFFEYDPYLTRIAGYDPLSVWSQLEALGYHHVAVWNHAGIALGHTVVGEAGAKAAPLDDFPTRRPGSRSYWDVAVVHRDDTQGLEVVNRLVPAAQIL
jgi:FkbM family methyltransferase